tara:strand:- start:1356 stop:1841 length:486 start_codon:yes stop_codon:yes gene_type:complete
MAYQKLQVSNGLAVIPSDTVRIPNPDTEVASGTADFSVAGTLTDVGTSFTTDVKVGDIVYDTTASIAYYVSVVVSDTELTLTPSSAGGATDVYTIYREATPGCVLFAGVAGDMGIQLAQQNGNANTTELTFKGIAAGAFLPTQAIRVDATKTTATDIIALW